MRYAFAVKRERRDAVPNVFGDDTDHDRMEAGGYLWKNGRYVDDPDHRHEWEMNKLRQQEWAEFEKEKFEQQVRYRKAQEKREEEKP